jgi:hypothetical protein
VGLNPLDRTYPFTVFLTSLYLTHTRTTVRVTPRPPLVIPWFLRGILEFLGEINSPRTGVSVAPTSFPHLKVFSPNPQSLCPMDGIEIPLVHCLHLCHRTISCNISKFPWLNRAIRFRKNVRFRLKSKISFEVFLRRFISCNSNTWKQWVITLL